MIHFVFGKAQREELGAILDLQKRAFRETAERNHDFTIQPLTQILEELEAEFERGIILAGREGPTLVASVRGYSDEGTVYVQKLMVDPDYQNRGLGKRMLTLLEEAFPDATRFELFTSVNDHKNRHIYEHFGYVPIRYESKGNVDFVFMEKRM